MFSKNYRNIENINKNKELLLKYPFLKPTKKYVDFYVGKDVDYDYSFIMADLFFDGYLLAFGNDLFDEIRNELIKTNDLNNCLLVFIGAGNLFHNFLKESLLFFEFFENFHGNKYNLNCILNKYKDMMKFICPICGNRQYYLEEKFLCDNCANEFKTRIYDIDFTPNLKLYSIVDFDKAINVIKN